MIDNNDLIKDNVDEVNNILEPETVENEIQEISNNVEEMEEIGYDDYFFGEGVCLIEWAELIEELIPEGAISITIEKDLEKGFDYRKITVE